VTGAPDRRPRERAAAAVVVDGPERQARSSVRSWSPRKVELGNVLEPGTVPSMMNQASHDYLERGWSIIPIRPEDKQPLIRWEEFQHRHPTEAEVQGWFSEWPTAGVGIVTGSISGLVVIDIDVRHGGDVALARLEQEHGHLPATLECCTGGGGCHLYFAHPGGLIRNKVGLGPGIDLRGDGGYVVAPPSLHASGRRYAWVESRDPRSRAVASPVPVTNLADAPDDHMMSACGPNRRVWARETVALRRPTGAVGHQGRCHLLTIVACNG
jgi:hypothetical protein